MRISPIELADCDRLSPFQPPGWDDIARDFRTFVHASYYDQVKGEVEGVIVAIGAIIYHADTAWLAKIIVHPDHRNKGYGKAITQGLIDRIDRSRYRTIYLDATDMGHPVYTALGFVDEVSYVHFSNPNKGTVPVDGSRFRRAMPADRPKLLALDRAVYGEDRELLLSDGFAEALVVEAKGQLVAAYFPTVHQGPIIGTHIDHAEPLIRVRLNATDRAHVPSTNEEAINALTGMGCVESRRSRRMFLGERRAWRPDLVFNRTSGQLG
jgi:GNAT superfamily N-acetyltransferase